MGNTDDQAGYQPKSSVRDGYRPFKLRTRIGLWLYLFIAIFTYGQAMRDCEFLGNGPFDTYTSCQGFAITFSAAWPLWWSEHLQR